jgi:ferredoxin
MTYIHKPEVKAFGKAAFVANVPALKTVMQLAAENQITDGQVIALAIDKTGSLSQLNTFAEMQSFIANNEPAMPAHIAEALAKVEAMSREERWNYWLSEMANCVKCYACRSACPMCYCAQCTTDCNQPQWIPVSSMGQANMEYHIMRAMHLAGRCVNCGECARVCPMEIPLGLLTAKLTGFIGQNFGSRAGTKPELDYALSTFKVEDKETFIR